MEEIFGDLTGGCSSAELPSSFQFTAKNIDASEKVVLDKLALPVIVGEVRDGKNSPPLVNLIKLCKRYYTSEPSLLELGLHLNLNGPGPELPNEDIIFDCFLKKYDLKFIVKDWCYLFPSTPPFNTNSNIISNKILFPISIPLSGETELYLVDRSSVMRYVSEKNCNGRCGKTRKFQYNRACEKCSTACLGELRGNNTTKKGVYTEQMKKWPTNHVITALLIANEKSLLYDFETPTYGTPCDRVNDVNSNQKSYFQVPLSDRINRTLSSSTPLASSISDEIKSDVNHLVNVDCSSTNVGEKKNNR